jgi:hypothetical protein
MKAHMELCNPLIYLARPERFELPTPWFVARYSIQLSYGRINFSISTLSLSKSHFLQCFTLRPAAPKGYSKTTGAICAANNIGLLNLVKWRRERPFSSILGLHGTCASMHIGILNPLLGFEPFSNKQIQGL